MSDRFPGMVRPASVSFRFFPTEPLSLEQNTIVGTSSNQGPLGSRLIPNFTQINPLFLDNLA